MGQYKVYINYTFTKLLFGISYDIGCSFELWLWVVKIGIGFDKTAKGFGFWRV